MLQINEIKLKCTLLSKCQRMYTFKLMRQFLSFQYESFHQQEAALF